MKIKQIALILIAVLVLGMTPAYATDSTPAWKEFYVSTQGSDANPGTIDAPFATLERAQKAVREVNNDMQGDIVVNILGGTYFLDKMLEFTPADSGKNGYNIIYRGEEGNMPVISGGKKVEGFTASAEYPGVYETTVEGIDRIGALYVNDVRRYMAKASRTVTGLKKPEKYDNKEWYDAHPNDQLDNHYNYHDPDTQYMFDGMYMSKEDIGFYENQQDIMFLWDDSWKTHVIPVESIEATPDDSSQVIVRMKRGLWDFAQKNNEWQGNYPRPEKGFIMMNAMEFLDEPGEYYYNRKTSKLYYMPYDYENMENSEVIVPNVEFLMFITGESVYNKVENVTFSGIRFAHNKWTSWMEGFMGEQADNTRALYDEMFEINMPYSLDYRASEPYAIVMQMTDNVDFLGNHFDDLSTSALNLANGVENSDITGNAFSDLGNGAIRLGSSMHATSMIGEDGVSDEPPADAGMVSLNDMIYHRINASYVGDWDAKGYNEHLQQRGLATLTGAFIYSIREKPAEHLRTWVEDYTYYGAWKSDPLSPARGEKSWVRYDFLKPYSMDKIVLAFDSRFITNEEKSNFEILVSNDKEFKEGTYEVVATQNSPASEIAEYTINTDEKYQYVMIRTLGATPLALSRAWTFTPDVKPSPKYERCHDNTITNNYIDRYGVDIHKATAILMYYSNDNVINHNEITDGGYSAMGLSWGWGSSRNGASNNDISYNYVHNVTQTTHDGGGLYSVGNMFGSTMTNNFVDGSGVGIRAYYQDSGSSEYLIKNNVAENAAQIMSPYNSSVKNNTYVDNYAPHTQAALQNAAGNNYEDPITYTVGQPPKEVYAIIERAGIEDEYEHIKSWVDDGENDLVDKKYLYDWHVGTHFDLKKTGSLAEANGILKSDAFGNSLGMFPPEYKFKLQKAVDALENANDANKMYMLLGLETAVREAKENVIRYTLPETVELAKKAAENAKSEIDGNKTAFGVYPEKEIKSFKDKVAELEKKANLVKNEEEEYEVLVALEKAYNDFTAKAYSADIAMVYSEAINGYSINKEKGEIVLNVPVTTDVSKMQLEIIPEGSAKIAVSLEKELDLTKPYNIPMYCKANDQYKHWIIKASVDAGNNAETIFDSNWYTESTKENPIKKSLVGTYLTASPHVYMSDYKSLSGGKTTFRFAPMTYNELNSFTFILGANIYNGLDRNGTGIENNRCEVVFNETEASLYAVNEGKKTLIKTVTTPLVYNEENTFTYEINNINGQTQVYVELNGETIFNSVVNINLVERYFGCFTDKVGIRIY